MHPEQQRCLHTLALFAALADDAKDERQHAHIRRMAKAQDGQAWVPDLMHHNVLLKRLSSRGAADPLAEPGQRQLAYEMASGREVAKVMAMV